MANVLGTDVAGELELDRENSSVFAFDDQVDLMLPAARSQMEDPGLRRLGVDPQRQGAERPGKSRSTIRSR